ncbi:MAG: hypothetical protein U9N81_08040 [Bacillota bacterium]|nr:hypothetical protein [Bacillota bacterium]
MQSLRKTYRVVETQNGRKMSVNPVYIEIDFAAVPHATVLTDDG